MAQSRFRQVGEGDTDFFTQGEEVPPPPGSPPYDRRVESNASPNFVTHAATSILFTSLKALSQRAVIAVAHLFVLATAISAFTLWYVTMREPTVLQLVGLALYGVLILALNWLVLKRV